MHRFALSKSLCVPMVLLWLFPPWNYCIAFILPHFVVICTCICFCTPVLSSLGTDNVVYLCFLQFSLHNQQIFNFRNTHEMAAYMNFYTFLIICNYYRVFCIVFVNFSSCLTLCNPVNRSTPGLPVHHQLPEFTQTHVR